MQGPGRPKPVNQDQPLLEELKRLEEADPQEQNEPIHLELKRAKSAVLMDDAKTALTLLEKLTCDVTDLVDTIAQKVNRARLMIQKLVTAGGQNKVLEGSVDDYLKSFDNPLEHLYSKLEQARSHWTSVLANNATNAIATQVQDLPGLLNDPTKLAVASILNKHAQIAQFAMQPQDELHQMDLNAFGRPGNDEEFRWPATSDLLGLKKLPRLAHITLQVQEDFEIITGIKVVLDNGLESPMFRAQVDDFEEVHVDRKDFPRIDKVQMRASGTEIQSLRFCSGQQVLEVAEVGESFPLKDRNVAPEYQIVGIYGTIRNRGGPRLSSLGFITAKVH